MSGETGALESAETISRPKLESLYGATKGLEGPKEQVFVGGAAVQVIRPDCRGSIVFRMEAYQAPWS